MKQRNHSRLLIVLLLAAFGMGTAASCVAQERQEKEQERRQSGWIGVMIRDVDKSLTDRKHLNSEEGAYVEDVVDQSPADSAGLKQGDVIVQFGSTTIEDANDLTRAVQKNAPGTKTSVTVLRDGEKKTLTITVGVPERSREFMMQLPPVEPRIRVLITRGTLGMELQTLNDQLAAYFGAPDDVGVLVERVKKNSAAEHAGFKAGDVIIRVADHPVDDVDDIDRRLMNFEEGDKVQIEVIRKGNRKTLTLEIEKRNNEYDRLFREFGQWNEGPRQLREGDGPAEFMPDTKELHENLEKMQQSLRQNRDQLRKTIRKTIRIMTTV